MLYAAQTDEVIQTTVTSNDYSKQGGDSEDTFPDSLTHTRMHARKSLFRLQTGLPICWFRTCSSTSGERILRLPLSGWRLSPGAGCPTSGAKGRLSSFPTLLYARACVRNWGAVPTVPTVPTRQITNELSMNNRASDKSVGSFLLLKKTYYICNEKSCLTA